MKAVVVCPQHNDAVTDGQLGWRLDEKDTQANLNELPKGLPTAVAHVQRMWLLDTSEMTCPETDGECHEGWEIHMFDDEGNWLAVSK